jgi:hypothetical protein
VGTRRLQPGQLARWASGKRTQVLFICGPCTGGSPFLEFLEASNVVRVWAIRLAKLDREKAQTTGRQKSMLKTKKCAKIFIIFY